MNNMKNTKLYNDIISDENIFAAIYSLESYIFERNLLDNTDLKLYYELKDKYNKVLIDKTINDCKTILNKVLLEDNTFEIQVYFKAKKYNEEKKLVECRPMHSASLITQICIVCLLNKIMFRKTRTGMTEFSDLTQLLPSNFFGNMPSLTPEEIFYDWKEKYKEYSDNIIKTYDSAKETGNYKYEVALDLSNYFPSIDPNIIYNYAIKKLAATYKNKELDALKKVFEKLLIFDITNLNTDSSIKRYYGENTPPAKHINLGIPQGLPQSYYFGNLCMIVISQEFNNKFPGEAFYYVDDSVIYTNSERANPHEFKKSLEELNTTILESLKEFSDKSIDNSGFKYLIEVHKDEKSISSEIVTANKMSRALLMPYTLEASNIGRELNSTIDSIEDHMLENKLESLSKGIESEIINVKEHMENLNKINPNIPTDSFDIYLKTLKRYKKFFLYRKKLLNFRNEKDIKNIRKEFKSKYFDTIHDGELADAEKIEIFKLFEEDIFLAEAQLIFSNLISNAEKKSFKDEMSAFEGALLRDVPGDMLFFTKNLENVVVDITSYTTLAKVAKNNLSNFSKASKKVIFEKLQNLLDNSEKGILGFGQGYDKYIYKFSNEYRRKLLNAEISKYFNVELSDNVEVFTKDNRAVKYVDLRLICFLRNRNCSIKDFAKFALDIVRESIDSDNIDYEKVDFSLYEVLNSFVYYVKKPSYIDNLILVHKYVSSIWKNGSKFLYFYTLHNQEHSIELIKASIKNCKNIDYLQLKTSDFYVLFLSCYLHDISMVLQPSIDEITKENNETDIIYTEVCEEIKDTLDKEHIKKLIKICFEKASNYFESISRDKHAYDSSKFIKNSSDLNFLDKPTRSFIANVSEAHGYGPNDVYGLRSKAKNEIISEKYMKILLRLADLLDGSKDRVSLNILNQNISNMPNISKYHWITHAAIDSLNLTSKYEFTQQKGITNLKSNKISFKSLLQKDNLNETILVEIRLNAFSLIGVDSNGCKGIQANLLNNSNDTYIQIIFDDDLSCDGKNCNFLCKWMCDKNYYLIEELRALQKYLNRNANNIFSTKIELRFIFTQAKSLSSNHFDIINSHISNKQAHAD